MSPFRLPAPPPEWSFVCVECASRALSAGACACCDEHRVDLADPAGRQCAIERDERRERIHDQRVRWSCVPFPVGAGVAVVRLFSAGGWFLEHWRLLNKGETVMVVAQWMGLFVIVAAAIATLALASLHALLPSPRLFGNLVPRPAELPRALDPSRRARRSVVLACSALVLIACGGVWAHL